MAESWSISPDFTTWTFTLQGEVQFHKGYGTMNAEDVLYSYQQWHEGALHPRAEIIGNFWAGNEGGSQEIIDDRTIAVNTGVPWAQVRALEFMRHLGGTSTWIVSKAQSDEIGAEAASKDIAATGPWEIVDHAPDEFWKFAAVRDHWRQTPFFEELIYWSIPEEATRVAAFQAEQIDSFDMSLEFLPTIQDTDGAVVVGVPGAGQAGLNLYGQTYGTDRNGNVYPFFDPANNPWVSANGDTESEEWHRALKVRKALAIAIDRELIVGELLSGFGSPLSLRDWMGFEDRADPSWVHEYDPDLARQLLAEVGYPDGFSILLTPAIRGAPAEVEACEAVALFWEDIGIRVDMQLIPYAALRPGLVSRDYQGATCLSVSGRISPIIGMSNYLKNSNFSYGTEHAWLEQHVPDALGQGDPAVLVAKEREVADWMFDNVMAFGLYTFDALWPVGPRLDPDWEPLDYSDVRLPNFFEYARHR